jgi:hypothetical protein
MDLVNKPLREPQIAVLTGLPIKAEEVADRERIGPQITTRLRRS